MANYFSDHYAAITSPVAEAIDDPKIKAAPGISHSKLRYKRGTITVPAAVTDDEQCRFFPLKSSDRLLNLYLSTPSLTGTTMTADIGIYDTEDDGNALADLDLFIEAATSPVDDLSVAIARVDVLPLGLTLEVEDIGKPLWELANEGALTLTEDPLKQWDIVLTMNTETAITAGAEIVLEAIYVAAE